MSKIVTENTCNICTPLGACLAIKGIQGCIPMLHGSQGCATYMRRFLIGHFREPIDIASSSFTEESAIFGGETNFKKGIENIISQYNPLTIAIVSTCLSETIGDDIAAHLINFKKIHSAIDLPDMFVVSTPSYSGNYTDGFYKAVYSIVSYFSAKVAGQKEKKLNLFPGILSCEDLRYLKETLQKAGVAATLVPDYSNSLDGGAWQEYKQIPPGGTSINNLENLHNNYASITFRSISDKKNCAGYLLKKKFNIPSKTINAPIGLRNTDNFWKLICDIFKVSMHSEFINERGRLLDAMADAHKYLAHKRVLLYGDLDFIIPLSSFLSELGMEISILATGSQKPRIPTNNISENSSLGETVKSILWDFDFVKIKEAAEDKNIDLIIGNSRGYKLARAMNLPMVRLGMPIHDRMGGQRILHVGYKGAMALLDLISNTLIQKQQDSCLVGYANM